MEYLVDMRLADSGRSTTPAEGLIFVEQYILPTLELCQRLATENRILAGGPVSGAVALAFIIRADTAGEIDEIVAGLPVWPRMVTTVTPLTTFADRASALRPRLERLRASKMPGEARNSEAAR
jgi:muconolactone delta-isomerase